MNILLLLFILPWRLRKNVVLLGRGYQGIGQSLISCYSTEGSSSPCVLPTPLVMMTEEGNGGLRKRFLVLLCLSVALIGEGAGAAIRAIYDASRDTARNASCDAARDVFRDMSRDASPDTVNTSSPVTPPETSLVAPPALLP